MQKLFPIPSSPGVAPLSYRPAEAAKALGVSERLLWTWTQEQNVPHVRIGKVVLYPVKALEDWLRQQSTCVRGDESKKGEEGSTADAVTG